MTFPLMALAVGAVVAGFFGIPAALGGGNAIEHFLEPSFTRVGHADARGTAAAEPRQRPRGGRRPRPRRSTAASRTRRAASSSG